ncbi:hypothetical protein SBV1_1760017 [Verrucomicrobia bacterium]|nr:hypothetical protein SBV1_1760017 [Verrucomicrobiota bacterium]
MLAIVLDGTFEPVNKGKAYETSLRDSTGVFGARSVDSKSTANLKASLRDERNDRRIAPRSQNGWGNAFPALPPGRRL